MEVSTVHVLRYTISEEAPEGGAVAAGCWQANKFRVM